MALTPVSSEGGGDPLRDDQVRLSDAARALAKIQTTLVRPQPGERRALRLLGRVEPAETGSRTVTAWTAGRIERLKVATTGAEVTRGQVIATLYSPDVYEAHQDLIAAREQLARLGAALPVAREAAKATMDAARQRLVLIGVSPGEVRRMAEAQEPWRRVQIRTPFQGTVLERLVSEGQYVEVGQGVYRLGDLSTLWVQLDAYERDLPLLSTGQQVTLTLEALPGEVFEGRVAFVDPVVDLQTRTSRVRVEVSNADGRLRPGMFAEAVVEGGAEGGAPTLVIPDTAPLFSGRRSLVYVELPGRAEPTYEAREVRLGPRTSAGYPVVAGLEYGERVVTHGAFRLDADLQIRGGRSLMARPDDRAPSLFDEVVVLSESDKRQLGPVVDAYLDAQEALAADKHEEARDAVGRMTRALAAVELTSVGAAAPWRAVSAELQTQGTFFQRASTIALARSTFEGMTVQVSRLLRVFGNPLEAPLRLAYCPMAFGNRGASWFQRGEVVRNAYFGAEMLECGEVRGAIGGGAFKFALEVEPAPASPSSPASMPSSSPASSPSSSPASSPGAEGGAP